MMASLLAKVGDRDAFRFSLTNQCCTYTQSLVTACSATPATKFIEHFPELLIPLLPLYCCDEDVLTLRGLRGED